MAVKVTPMAAPGSILPKRRMPSIIATAMTAAAAEPNTKLLDALFGLPSTDTSEQSLFFGP